MTPELAKTPEGNRALLNVLKSQSDRAVQVAKIINQGRTDGLSEREIQLEANNFLLNGPGAAPSNVIRSVKKISD